MDKPFFDSDKMQVEVFSLDDNKFDSSELSFLKQNNPLNLDQVIPEDISIQQNEDLQELNTEVFAFVEKTNTKFQEFSDDLNQIFSDFDKEVSRILTHVKSIDSTENIHTDPQQTHTIEPDLNTSDEIVSNTIVEEIEEEEIEIKDPIENNKSIVDDTEIEESSIDIENYATEELPPISNDVKIENDLLEDDLPTNSSLEEIEEITTEPHAENEEEISDSSFEEEKSEESNEILNLDDVITDNITPSDSTILENNTISEETSEDISEDNDISFSDIIEDIDTEEPVEHTETSEELQLEETSEDTSEDNDISFSDIIEDIDTEEPVEHTETPEELQLEETSESEEIEIVEYTEETVENTATSSEEILEELEEIAIEKPAMSSAGISLDMLSQLNSSIPTGSENSFTQLTKDEVKDLMSEIDNLLEYLPEEKIEELSHKDFYHNYIRFLDDLGI